ncbi:hypothetical protein [Iamia sp.]|uniref:hypothetical protein n=1 Tax=Iamia sp. TaxID=2722710 RepID=UPI002D02A9DA|nr:hypothetical protein [Iamia sp.]HXH55957.1 hypothetical protein [Iamia sp.]
MRSAERQEGLRTSGCADRWLVVDSRPRRWHDGPVVDEADAEAFLRLRPQVESFGVELVDVVIFDDQCHWWSLHELTTGTASWTPQPMRLAS